MDDIDKYHFIYIGLYVLFDFAKYAVLIDVENKPILFNSMSLAIEWRSISRPINEIIEPIELSYFLNFVNPKWQFWYSSLIKQ